MKIRSSAAVILILFLLSPLLGACGGAGNAGRTLTLAPKSALPDFVRDAPPNVQEAYRFAIANPDVLRQYPCYCGCGNMGHKNNRDCYIREARPDGSIEFETHALG